MFAALGRPRRRRSTWRSRRACSAWSPSTWLRRACWPSRPAGRREALRTRPCQRGRPGQRAAPVRPGGPALPDRPLLGKEPVQDILHLRFANSPAGAGLEPRPRARDHDHDGRVLRRGRPRQLLRPRRRLRDVVQNHILQMLALTCLEPPSGSPMASRRLDFFRGRRDRRQVRGRGSRPVRRLPESQRRGAGLHHRDLRGPQAESGVVALGRGPHLHPDRQGDADDGDRDRRAAEEPAGWCTRAASAPGHDDIVLRIGKELRRGVLAADQKPGTDFDEPEMVNLDFAQSLGYIPTPTSGC